MRRCSQNASWLACVQVRSSSSVGSLERMLGSAPFKGGGTLFYHRLGDGAHDLLSDHAGCPPREGEAWKINGFMWNVDSSVGPRYFR